MASALAMAQEDTTPVAFTANTLQNTVTAFDMNNNNMIAIMSGFDSPVGVAFSPADNRLYVTNSGGNSVSRHRYCYLQADRGNTGRQYAVWHRLITGREDGLRSQ